MKSLYAKIFLFFLLIMALFLGLRFLLPLLLPFFLAAALALWAEPAVSWMHSRLRMPRALAAGIGVSGVFLLLLTVVTLLLAGLLRQVPRLTGLIPQIEEALLVGKTSLENSLLSLAQRMPGSVGTLLRQWAEGLFSGEQLTAPLLQRIPQVITGLAGKMSQGLFGLVTGLIASVMLSVRLPQIRQWLHSRLPQGFFARAQTARQRLREALGGWGLAQCKLAGVTFLVLCAGFFLLRLPSPLLLASVVTLVDAFPVLGVGTVLVPWALVCFLQGQTARALGLLGMYGIAWLLRSVLEPRLVGSSLGLDPLVTLGVIYAGFRLGGILGMLLAPMLAMMAMQLWKAWK